MYSKMIHVTPGLGWERRNQESSRECENDHISEVIKRMCVKRAGKDYLKL